MTSKPKYAIVDEVDAPMRSMVCELTPIGYCYMNRCSDKYLKKLDGMNPQNPTSIEEFGFKIVEKGGMVQFIRERESIATYTDGCPRKWQDTENSQEFCLFRVRLKSGERSK